MAKQKVLVDEASARLLAQKKMLQKYERDGDEASARLLDQILTLAVGYKLDDFTLARLMRNIAKRERNLLAESAIKTGVGYVVRR
jgi:hypothetical protein